LVLLFGRRSQGKARLCRPGVHEDVGVDASRGIPVLWLCGPPGVGKSAVGWSVYSRLSSAETGCAYVDIDQLGICSLELADDSRRHRLKARNLDSLISNFTNAGARCIVVSGVVDARRGVAIDSGARRLLTVVRLRADDDELRDRLVRRQGSLAVFDEARAEARVLETTSFANATLDTTRCSVEEVAEDVLALLGDWPLPGYPPASEPARSSSCATQPQVDGSILFLGGATGSGKSTIGFRAYLNLLSHGPPAAYVDTDQLAFLSSSQGGHRLRAANLAAIWANYHVVGARCLLATGPFPSRSEASAYEEALPGASFAWCRLHVGREELARRILTRAEGGSWPQPGDPLRGRPESELLRVADAAAVEAEALEAAGFGLRIDANDLAVDRAASFLVGSVALGVGFHFSPDGARPQAASRPHPGRHGHR
jgi:adenylylsulfate kinase-like enzyme